MNCEIFKMKTNDCERIRQLLIYLNNLLITCFVHCIDDIADD